MQVTEGPIVGATTSCAWTTTLSGTAGDVYLDLYHDATNANAAGQRIVRIFLTNAQADALATALTTPSATSGP
jgi:hypothetical protein